MDVDLLFVGAHPDDDMGVLATFARYLRDEGYKGTVDHADRRGGRRQRHRPRDRARPRPHPRGGGAPLAGPRRRHPPPLPGPPGFLLHPLRGGGGRALGRPFRLRRDPARAPGAARGDRHHVAGARHPRPAPDGGPRGHPRLRARGRPGLLPRADHGRVPAALRARSSSTTSRTTERARASSPCRSPTSRAPPRCPTRTSRPSPCRTTARRATSAWPAFPPSGPSPRPSFSCARACRWPRSERHLLEGALLGAGLSPPGIRLEVRTDPEEAALGRELDRERAARQRDRRGDSGSGPRARRRPRAGTSGRRGVPRQARSTTGTRSKRPSGPRLPAPDRWRGSRPPIPPESSRDGWRGATPRVSSSGGRCRAAWKPLFDVRGLPRVRPEHPHGVGDPLAADAGTGGDRTANAGAGGAAEPRRSRGEGRAARRGAGRGQGCCARGLRAAGGRARGCGTRARGGGLGAARGAPVGAGAAHPDRGGDGRIGERAGNPTGRRGGNRGPRRSRPLRPPQPGGATGDPAPSHRRRPLGHGGASRAARSRPRIDGRAWSRAVPPISRPSSSWATTAHPLRGRARSRRGGRLQHLAPRHQGPAALRFRGGHGRPFGQEPGHLDHPAGRGLSLHHERLRRPRLPRRRRKARGHGGDGARDAGRLPQDGLGATRWSSPCRSRPCRWRPEAGRRDRVQRGAVRRRPEGRSPRRQHQRERAWPGPPSSWGASRPCPISGDG